jgi:hypothetical protein
MGIPRSTFYDAPAIASGDAEIVTKIAAICDEFAVDHEGEVLDTLVQRRRDKRAALRLMRKLVKKQGFTPKLLTTDKLGSYGAAFRHLQLTCRHEQGLRKKQSRRKFPSSGATTRAQDATVQVSSICPALPQHPCRRPQHVQPSTPPHLSVHAAGLPSRSGGAVARCRRNMKSGRGSGGASARLLLASAGPAAPD